MGYELVETERTPKGLCRVFIDNIPSLDGKTAEQSSIPVTVDDCEKVTRQLQHVLDVEGFVYERLEVSSPGLDRPLRKPSDRARFAGSLVEVTLKAPYRGRKRYQGVLEAGAAEGWRISFEADGALIELVIDDARVEAADCVDAFLELELELKAGDVGALEALAARLSAVARLTPTGLTKAGRGFRLLGAGDLT
jgi:ribosome maturation factor RimP